jgi:hypothetical protein
VVAAVESIQLDKAADELKYASRRLDKRLRGNYSSQCGSSKKSGCPGVWSSESKIGRLYSALWRNGQKTAFKYLIPNGG